MSAASPSTPPSSSVDPPVDPRVDPPFDPSPSAFRRPGLLLLMIGYRLVAGLLIAAPIASFFNTFVSGYPRGDAELFDPGGLMLLEALRLGTRALPVTMVGAGLPALVAVFAGLLPLAALIAGLARRGPLPRAFLARAALARIGTLALVWGTGIAAQLLLAVLVVLLGGKVVDTLHLQAHPEDIAYLILAAVTALVMIAAGVVRDLAAVATVAHEDRFYVAVSRALRTAVRLPGRVAWAYGLRAVLAVAAVGAAFQLAPPGAGPLGAPFAVHEAAIVITVILHASWLAAAIHLLTVAAPPRRAEPSSPSSTTEPSVTQEEPSATVVVDEPVIDEPVIDEPVLDEPVIDEPAVSEPVDAPEVVASPEPAPSADPVPER